MGEIQSNNLFTPTSFAFKVCSLYNILQIAVSTYVTNVRNYLDRAIPPKILNLLIAIRETTIICVDRGLFDSDDCVVQVSDIA